MSPVKFLFVFVSYMNTGDCSKSRPSEVDYYGPFQPYAQPVHLPLLPQYEIDIPAEQEAKRFGGVAATRYETIIVRETVRPVCLFVDGNVPPCDHIHNNYNNHAKDGMALNARRPTNDDYESYFIEPSKPDVKIEITEIPFKGAYVLTDTTVEPNEEHAAADGLDAVTTTPPLQLLSEDGHNGSTKAQEGGGRQIVQNVLGAAGTAISAGLGANVAGLVTNAGGALLRPGNVAGLAAAAFGHGGNRDQVTVYVTRVNKVVDDQVTVTLVPKNCMPAAGQVHALRPCPASYPPYAVAGQAYHPQPSLPPPPPPPSPPHQTRDDEPQDQDEDGPEESPLQYPLPVAAADIVSQVNGLVRELVGHHIAVGPAPVPAAGTPGIYGGHRYRVNAARPFGGPF